MKFLLRTKLFLFGYIAIGGGNQHSIAMSVNDLIGSSLSHHLGIQGDEAGHTAALERVASEGALPDPVLKVTRFVESVETRTGPQHEVYTLSQRLPWSGKLRLKENQARIAADAQRYEFESNRDQLAAHVSYLYFEYAYSTRARGLCTERITLLDEWESSLEQKVMGGASAHEWIEIKLEREKLLLELQQIDAQCVEYRAQLFALTGGQIEIAADTIEMRIPQPLSYSLESLFSKMESDNAEIRMLRAHTDTASIQEALAKLNGYPDFTLGLNYIRVGGALNASTPDAGKDPWGVSLSVQVPLWRGVVRARRAEAIAIRKSVEYRVDQRVLDVKADLNVWVVRHGESFQRFQKYREQLVPLAEKSIELRQIQYESGKLELASLVEGKLALLELKAAQLRGVADVWQARYAIAALTGDIDNMK